MRHNRSFRRTDGFTLMELMAVIAAASIVTLAATTLMLFGLRSNSRTIDAMKQQNTARLLMMTLEDLATRGTIAQVNTGLDENDPNVHEDDENYWEIKDDAGIVLYSYVSETATLYAGGRPNGGSQKGTVLLENVVAFYADLSNAGVLTFSLETEDDTYTSSVYCRNRKVEVKENDQVIDQLDQTVNNAGQVQDTGEARLRFLRTLANQYKLAGGQVNNGLILDNKTSTGKYYSEWYIGGYESNPGWNSMTPWCACFLSWGLNQCAGEGLIDIASLPLLPSGNYRTKWYASVDDYVRYFDSGTPVLNADGSVTGHYWIKRNQWHDNNGNVVVRPGDLIIFDWNLDNDPSHIGAVLLIDKDAERVYTIEGNTSNRVGVRSYKLSDPRILGYGVIDWIPTAAQ